MILCIASMKKTLKLFSNNNMQAKRNRVKWTGE